MAACVPGAFGAWLTLLRDWGSRPLRACLAPAIHYAGSGVPPLPGAMAAIAAMAEVFGSDWPSSGAIWLPALGGARRLVNPQLAALYSAVLEHAERSARGREAQIEAALDYWYRGPVAEAIGAFVGAEPATIDQGLRSGGVLRADDMAAWRAPVERAASTAYRDAEVFKCGSWTQGPAMLQALAMLRDEDVGRLDPTGPDHVHLVAEVLKLALADRDAWLGDGADLEGFLDPAYLAARRSLVGDTASHEYRPGHRAGREPWRPRLIEQGTTPMSPFSGAGEPTFGPSRNQGRDSAACGDTCHVDTADRWGNMVSATPSGGWLQSSPAVPGLGFALGTRLQMFWLEGDGPNLLAPGKRPRTTLTPTLAYRDGRPWLAYGTPGGDQQEQWSLQFLLLHLDHRLPMQQTIDHPSFHTEHLVSSFYPREIALGSLVVEERLPKATRDELEARGHRLLVGGPWSEGRLSACAVGADSHGLELGAAANPRGMQGYAIAR